MRLVAYASLFLVLGSAHSAWACSCAGPVQSFYEFTSTGVEVGVIEFIDYKDDTTSSYDQLGRFVVRDTILGFEVEIGDTIYVGGSFAGDAACMVNFAFFSMGDTIVAGLGTSIDTLAYPLFGLTVVCTQSYVPLLSGEYDGLDVAGIRERIYQEMREKGRMEFFPNPNKAALFASDELNFKSDGENISSITLYNLHGQVCHREEFQDVETARMTPDIPPGIYWGSVRLTDGRRILKKIVRR